MKSSGSLERPGSGVNVDQVFDEDGEEGSGTKTGSHDAKKPKKKGKKKKKKAKKGAKKKKAPTTRKEDDSDNDSAGETKKEG